MTRVLEPFADDAGDPPVERSESRRNRPTWWLVAAVTGAVLAAAGLHLVGLLLALAGFAGCLPGVRSTALRVAVAVPTWIAWEAIARVPLQDPPLWNTASLARFLRKTTTPVVILVRHAEDCDVEPADLSPPELAHVRCAVRPADPAVGVGTFVVPRG